MLAADGSHMSCLEFGSRHSRNGGFSSCVSPLYVNQIAISEMAQVIVLGEGVLLDPTIEVTFA